MKIRLLFAFIAFSLASCSSDDGSSGKDPSGTTGEKKLREIVQTDFNADGSVKQTSKTEFDDNDKTLLELQYDGTGEITTKREFAYNKSGQLETMAYYTAASGLETPSFSTTYAYDANGRITTVNDSGSQGTSVSTYLYNPNGTIIMTRDSAVTTYYVNSTGQVYKKLDSEGITEQITYIGANMLSYSNGTVTSTFAFDTEHTPKGQQHNVIVNQYNGNMSNTLMLGGFSAINLGKDKYAIQRTDGNGDVYDYEYDFDDEGYPVKLRYFKNEASIPVTIREIYYK